MMAGTLKMLKRNKHLSVASGPNKLKLFCIVYYFFFLHYTLYHTQPKHTGDIADIITIMRIKRTEKMKTENRKQSCFIFMASDTLFLIHKALDKALLSIDRISCTVIFPQKIMLDKSAEMINNLF